MSTIGFFALPSLCCIVLGKHLSDVALQSTSSAAASGTVPKEANSRSHRWHAADRERRRRQLETRNPKAAPGKAGSSLLLGRRHLTATPNEAQLYAMGQAGTNGCSLGQITDSTTCLAAGKSFGRSKLREGTWSTAPKGCYRTSYSKDIVNFNAHPIGTNQFWATPICQAVPTTGGTRRRLHAVAITTSLKPGPRFPWSNAPRSQMPKTAPRPSTVNRSQMSYLRDMVGEEKYNELMRNGWRRPTYRPPLLHVPKLVFTTRRVSTATTSTIPSEVPGASLPVYKRFLGDPIVLHTFAFSLGIFFILCGRQFPHLLALASSLMVGLLVGLAVQERQGRGEAILGMVVFASSDYWVPHAFAAVAAALTLGLIYITWRVALLLLSCSVCVLIAISCCRLVGIPTAQRVHLGASTIPAYSVVGAAALLCSVVLMGAGVYYWPRVTISWTSVHVGALLLLDGVSLFTQSVYSSDPFSLLDDLARIYAEVQSGKCSLTSSRVHQCDCAKLCRTEIVAWFVIAWMLLGLRLYHHYLRHSARESIMEARKTNRKAVVTDEEIASLTDGAPCDSIPPRAVVVGTDI